MKKVLIFLLLVATLLCFAACGKTKTLHCDRCGKEENVAADSNMTEDWIIYCKECEQEVLGENSAANP